MSYVCFKMKMTDPGSILTRRASRTGVSLVTLKQTHTHAT